MISTPFVPFTNKVYTHNVSKHNNIIINFAIKLCIYAPRLLTGNIEYHGDYNKIVEVEAYVGWIW